MQYATSYVALGALNPVLNSARTSVFLDVLSWEADRKALRELEHELNERARAEDREAFELRELLKIARPAQVVEVAEGSERGRVRRLPPDREFSDALRKQLERDDLSCAARSQLEQDLKNVLEQEERTIFRSEGRERTLEHVGRLAPKLAEKLAASSKFRRADAPMELGLEPGEVAQLVLRVRHAAPCVIRVTQLAHVGRPELDCTGATAADLRQMRDVLVDRFVLIVRANAKPEL